MLYRWKEEVLIKSPHSVVEIDTQFVDEKVYFLSFLIYFHLLIIFCGHFHLLIIFWNQFSISI
jgi:hypothetical protein